LGSSEPNDSGLYPAPKLVYLISIFGLGYPLISMGLQP
jgi:hypothetical protein